MKLALASLAAILAAPIAVAQGDVELSAGYTQFDADGADLGALTGRGTYFFNRYLGAEGEVSIGVDDADVGPGTVELDNSLGAFGVVRAPVTERLELFGRVGYAASEFNASVPGLGSASQDIDGLVLLTGNQQEDLFKQIAASPFKPRLSHAFEFARQRRVLLLQHRESGIKIDISFADRR